ncbi:hypothetical protein C3B59_08810 [Cryobacterium zongtaii]|uniref:Uncharacterized protein n=1 Tax=Cryobacterium zongtaii TaxID=1259217 RepID=A0A2S3ZFW2_9MICO|nr:hypothetical protein C3B59_08810 [Cryobacterium zongtaii]
MGATVKGVDFRLGDVRIALQTFRFPPGLLPAADIGELNRIRHCRAAGTAPRRRPRLRIRHGHGTVQVDGLITDRPQRLDQQSARDRRGGRRIGRRGLKGLLDLVDHARRRRVTEAGGEVGARSGEGGDGDSALAAEPPERVPLEMLLRCAHLLAEVEERSEVVDILPGEEVDHPGRRRGFLHDRDLLGESGIRRFQLLCPGIARGREVLGPEPVQFPSDIRETCDHGTILARTGGSRQHHAVPGTDGASADAHPRGLELQCGE